MDQNNNPYARLEEGNANGNAQENAQANAQAQTEPSEKTYILASPVNKNQDKEKNQVNAVNVDANERIKKLFEEWYVFVIGTLTIILLGLFCRTRALFDHLHMPDWNIRHFWDEDKIVFFGATGFMIVLIPSIWLVNWRFTTSDDKRKEVTNSDIAKCFTAYFCIAFASIWIGHEDDLYEKGFSSAFWSLLFGAIITNVWKTDLNKHWFNLVRKDADFFIKLSLVCLYVKIYDLLEIAGRSILISWVIHIPIVYGTSFLVGKYMNMGEEANNDDIKLSLMAGCVTICGSSAVTAIRDLMVSFPGIKDRVNIKENIKKDGDVIIAISSMLTTIYMMTLPFIGRGLGLGDKVVGSAIGACVDSTGQVIASAAMFSDLAKEIAQVVKMIQNIAIAPLCVFISVRGQNENKNEKVGSNILGLAWKNFPKFVFGFILNSMILSLIIMPASGDNADQNADFVIKMGAFIAEWFEIYAFLCIGLKLNYEEITKNFAGNGIQKWILLYIIVQTIDTILAFSTAYLVFGNFF